MLTAQSANPDVALRPFIHWYVQRETLSKNGEIVEPVFPRAGAMLEFQFATFYEVRAYGTEQLRPSWATTVIGPIDSRSGGSFCEIMCSRWSCFSGRSACIACLGCRSHL